MSGNDIISPVNAVPVETNNMTLKDTLEPTITESGETNVVDGAYTKTNGIISSEITEPVVSIAQPIPVDVNAELLPKETNTIPQNNTENINVTIIPTTSNNIDAPVIPNEPAVVKNADDIPSSTSKESLVEPAVVENGEKKKLEDVVVSPNDVVLGDITLEEKPVVIEEDKKKKDELLDSSGITPRNKGNNNIPTTTTTTTTPSIPSTPKRSLNNSYENNGEPSGMNNTPSLTHNRTVSNNSNHSNNSNLSSSANNNMPPGTPQMHELKSSARNLRNSVLGIEMEEEVDENGVRVRKVRRKERTHSKIVLRHKKNLIGETIYKGHQSWVLMLNIQTGIRNAVGRGHRNSTISVPNNNNNNHNNNNNIHNVNNSNVTNSSENNINNNILNNKNVGNSSAPANVVSAIKSPIEFLGPDNFSNISEFYASPKVLNFPPEGSANTIPHTTGPFKFKDYCPHAFRFLRHRFGIDTADYMVSLCNTLKNGENALRELPTPGKSGSLFFFSHDMRFILKTIPKSEAKLLRTLLPSYVEHIANDENTLLPKFFGLHRVKPHRGRQVRFLVMNNIFQTRKTIHERYDLKGSTLGRRASDEERKKDTVTYKDLDFLERHMKIQIGPQKRVALLEQLKRDTLFLAKLNIMDYSLLIGVHNSEKEDEYLSAPPSPHQTPKHINPLDLSTEYFHSIFQENDGGMRGLDESNGTIYYMGIIDILMLYSLRKKVEHTYKSLRYGKDEQISSVSPHQYAIRFYDFVSAAIT